MKKIYLAFVAMSVLAASMFFGTGTASASHYGSCKVGNVTYSVQDYTSTSGAANDGFVRLTSVTTRNTTGKGHDAIVVFDSDGAKAKRVVDKSTTKATRKWTTVTPQVDIDLHPYFYTKLGPKGKTGPGSTCTTKKIYIGKAPGQ